MEWLTYLIDYGTNPLREKIQLMLPIDYRLKKSFC